MAINPCPGIGVSYFSQEDSTLGMNVMANTQDTDLQNIFSPFGFRSILTPMRQ